MKRKGLVRFLSVNDVYRLEHLPKLCTLMNKETCKAEKWATQNGGAPWAVKRIVAGDFLSPNVLSAIDSGLSFMKCWNALDISHLCNITDHGLTPLVRKLHQLKSLKMDGCVSVTDSFVRILSIIFIISEFCPAFCSKIPYKFIRNSSRL